MTDLSGQYLGRYHLSERLGEGGMAVVYKAFDTRLERDVAVKIIRSGAFPTELMDDVLKRFEREAKSLARLSHPNIVKVHDYGEHEGAPYLVMEYLSGGTLRKVLGKPVPWQEAVHLILPVARGVAYAHQRGILHRDIKPANILLTEGGEPMLSDFGIAKILEGDQVTALTSSGMAIGTPEYMAPEQWTGTTSPRSDQYSLGIVLYEMVAGRKPYVGDTPAAILIKQATEPLPSPRKFADDLPEALEEILIRSLAKEPEDRYSDTITFASMLANFQASAAPVHPPEPKHIEEPHKSPLQQPSIPVRAEILDRNDDKTKDAVVEAGKELPLPSTPVSSMDDGRTINAFDTAESKPVKSVSSPPVPARSLRSVPGFSLKWAGLLASGIFIALALWLGLPVIGRWFSPSPIATDQLTAQPSLDAQSDVRLTLESTHEIATSSRIMTPIETGIPTSTLQPTLAPGTAQISAVDGMTLHYIPAGTFIMGDTVEHASAECLKTGPSPEGCSLDRFTDEEPIHNVYLDAYWMDETEVTNEKYKLCVGAHVCKPPSTISPYYGDDRHGDYPVVFVSWSDAKSYCNWAGRRLPTEAEWEKAARGTDGRTYPWGESTGTEYANYNTTPGDVTRAGSYESGKSPYGLYDMAGNVYEFVADWYQPAYYKTLGENVKNPQGPSSGQSRVAKGGGFLYNAIRPAGRDGRDRASNENGFRCALSADSATSQPETAQTTTPAPEANALPTEITDDKGVSMRLVPASEFTMGFSSGNKDEKPSHAVYLDDYYLDTYEVTNGFYKVCVSAGICNSPKNFSSQTRPNYYGNLEFDNYPVIYVDWDMAKTYCEWRGAQLPTEAQWEKAARGTDGRAWPWGNNNADCDRVNYCKADTTEVGRYENGKSPYGIYDLAGNVWEWVADWYSETYYQNSPASNPVGPDSGQYRVLRGGAWYLGYVQRVSYRLYYSHDEASNILGFRCARNATP